MMRDTDEATPFGIPTGFFGRCCDNEPDPD
jgi:hypothetical protein